MGKINNFTKQYVLLKLQHCSRLMYQFKIKLNFVDKDFCSRIK
jgi:hypothetical protein